MKRMRKFVLALSASAMLAIGAAAPAFAGGPPAEPGQGVDTACEVAASPAHAALSCRP